MSRALDLARAQLGLAWPNPAVGCVIVKDDRVISQGATAAGGRPHAESLAIQRAGEDAKNATVFVSLEPCCHWGQTSPCTEALIEAKISKVVIAVLDSDPRMRGEGVRALREASVDVELGLCESEARELNVGFFYRITTGRPWVTVIGTGTQWEDHICDQDAVLSARGSGLYLSFEYHRRRRSRFHCTDWFLGTGGEVNKKEMASLGGTELMIVDCDAKGQIDLKQALNALGHLGLTRVIVDASDPLAEALHGLRLVQTTLD